MDVEHEPRSTKIPDRVLSVCGWGVNAHGLGTRFEEERDVCDVSLEYRAVEEEQWRSVWATSFLNVCLFATE